MHNKNCYLSLGAVCEETYYSYYIYKCKNCSDCTKILECELCFECTDCTRCYNLHYSQDCTGCSDSQFIYDCKNCQNCFCSAGIRNKRFVYENEQLTEEEYKTRLSKTENSHTKTSEHLQKLEKLKELVPHLYIHGVKNEDVSGDYITNCKNLTECYDCLEGLENYAYCDGTGGIAHKLYNCSYSGMQSTQYLEMNGTTQMNNCKFIFYARSLSDSEYCQYCDFSHDLFGCFGLKHKQYCILNKQYEPGEYKTLRDRLINHMRKTGEYGEYFPQKHATFPYKKSAAFHYFPE